MRQRYYASGPQGHRWGIRESLDLVMRGVVSDGVSSYSMQGKPSLPPVLICGLSLWATSALWYPASQYASCEICLATGIGSLFLGAAFIFLLVRKKLPLHASVALFGICLGLASSSFASCQLHATLDFVGQEHPQIVGLTLEEDARASSYGSYSEAIAYDENGNSYKVRAFFNASDDCYLFGQSFAIRGTLEGESDEYAEQNWSKGIVGTVNVENPQKVRRNTVESVISSLRETALNALTSSEGEEDGKTVLAALSCGYRVDLYDSNVYTDFKIAGLAHLVAVSGAHLTLASMLVFMCLSALRFPKIFVLAGQIIFIAGYLVFTGMPISAVRAAIMAIASQSAWLAKRRASPLSALGLCIMVLVALDPVNSVSISFALSALSVLGIALFTPLISSWFSNRKSTRPGKFSESFSATLSSNVLSLPLSASLFSQIPLVSPLANLVAAPLFTLVCGGGLVCSVVSLLNFNVAQSLFSIAVAACSAMCRCIGTLASIPYASIPFAGDVSLSVVLTGVIAFALWAKWPHLSVRVAIGSIAGAVFVVFISSALTPITSGTTISALDVGQGDAILLSSNGNTVLVDTGNQDTKLLEALARKGVYHLDAIVITHGDDDHMGSLTSLRGIVQVDRVLVCKYAKDCSCDNCKKLINAATELVGDESIVSIGLGNTLHCGDFTLDVIWPESFTDEGGNADSLCLLVTADVDNDNENDFTGLLCGDAEDAQLDALLACGRLGRIDFYKVGHHGSKNAIDEQTALAIKPEISFVSVGADNSYGHPASSTLSALVNAGSKMYRTDEMGDITCTVSATRISVSTQRSG